ncbi:hypothetical protein C0991_005311, partial [Blastosporella zonata]
EQKEFLEARMPDYLKHQAAGTLEMFWSCLLRAWLERWKETVPEDVSPAEHDKIEGALIKSQKAKLKVWYQNNSKAKGKANTTSKALTLALNPPKVGRCLKASEVYSRKHYAEKIRPKVEAELESMEDPPKFPIGIIQRHIHQVWCEEDNEVCHAVIEEMSASSSQEKEKLCADSSCDRTPQELAAAIKCLPDAIQTLNNSLSKQTGWVWTILGGGPDPAFDGRV